MKQIQSEIEDEKEKDTSGKDDGDENLNYLQEMINKHNPNKNQDH